jgi:ABC-type glutathione transport system ATPase component
VKALTTRIATWVSDAQRLAAQVGHGLDAAATQREEPHAAAMDGGAMRTSMRRWPWSGSPISLAAYPHELSGGLAQRASLARALVNDPHLLMLDEPLGKLDSLTRLAMQRELSALWQREGFTALLVTHDVEEALLLADRVLVLSDRPARILADLRVEVPRPRRRDHARLVALRNEVLALLGLAEAA